MDACFLITTHNRQESCQRLVDALQGQGHIVVLNDGCDYVINGCEQHFLPNHNGKAYYWMTVKTLFAFRGTHKYYFMLPDDWLPVDNMVQRAINVWDNIFARNKICLNLIADRIGCGCWTNFKPIDYGNCWNTQWVDMCFMCEESFFKTIGTIPKLHAHRSSGVGAFISRKLHKLKYNMYQVKESLVIPQPEHSVSQMHQIIKVSQYETNRRHIHIKNTRSGI
jgi:hypothetical protein